MMLSNATASRRPSIQKRGSSAFFESPELYSDSRTHGYQGPTRHVRLPRATSGGGGAIARSEDGVRCVVAGKESLRILRMAEPSAAASLPTDHKLGVGRGGHSIEASRNLWEGSGLKIDSASTDVVWGHGLFNNKILTSARNGELIMWDLNKSGTSKYERRARVHTRSIHALAYSSVVQYYCMTGSADGELRVWDMRTDLTKYVVRIRHPAAVRAIKFSPIHWQPLHAVAALDNGSIYRWDLNMGQRGQLDRIPVAHAGPILALDWTLPPFSSQSSMRHAPQSSWYGGSSGGTGLLDDILPVTGSSVPTDGEGTGAGWLVSGGLDRSVKVWDLTGSSSKTHVPHDPTYHLRTSFPVRQVLWRPGYECELAVVSNAEFGAGANMDLPLNTATAGAVSPLGVGSGLTSVISSPLIPPATITLIEDTSTTEDRGTSVTRNDGSDPIEIWDVRRGYIAKWVVSQSAVEGGVSDMAFADSHAIWAQHSSGTFSQLDLRQSVKPLDDVPHTALSWDAFGSLTFVTDKPRRWEIPFDDIHPEKLPAVREWNKVKALGDPPFLPASQNLGVVVYDRAGEDQEMFMKLAEGYIYEGIDKRAICVHNAKVATTAGNQEAAQVWLMLDTLMTDLTPETLPTHPPAQIVRGMPHSISAPAAIPTVHTLPPNFPPRSSSMEADNIRSQKDESPGAKSKNSEARTGSSGHQSPLGHTPGSSNASSPRKPSGSLPVSPSIFARRESAAQPAPMRPRLASSFRRPSFSTPSVYSAHSESPVDPSKSRLSLRHVGEGALDDSDSSGSDEDGDDGLIGSRPDSEEEYMPSPPPVSPRLQPRSGSANPSPLSRVAGRQAWTEDEREDEDSPSPASTSASESDGSLRHKLRRGNSTRSKTRSRSSTVASLAITAAHHRALERQASRSSIQTVTAGSAAFIENVRTTLLRRDETIRDMHRSETAKTSPYHHRTRSEALSSELLLDSERHVGGDGLNTPSSTQTSHLYEQAIQEAERRFRELGWEAVRKALESYAEEGDVQLCAFLSLVAPKELKVSISRLLRFVEAYIDILNRLRLHTCAAYMRKFIDVEEVRSLTSLQTTIYTACGRCRKPIMLPAIPRSDSGRPTGRYAFCKSCKSNFTTCSICHLPVRALLFKCPVCMHGGHEECYRAYYMCRPMVELVPAHAAFESEHSRLSTDLGSISESSRGRAASRSDSKSNFGADSDGGSDDNTPLRGESKSGVADSRGPDDIVQALLGHPCAVGCGHYCWVVRGKLGDS